MKIEFESMEEFRSFVDCVCSLKEKVTKNAEKQKAYRDRKKVTDGNETVTNGNENAENGNETVTHFQEERENEKENEEKERSKEKEVKERVKEKEELINIYAEPKAKVEKHRYGNFRHVLLSDDEYQRLHADFPDLQDRIQRLDDYLENTGKVYKNHSLTIRNWANRDAQQAQPKQIPKEETFHDLKVRMEQREQDNVIDSFWRI
jgi:predicted  nucleic acid-binding Zn-ribbon protein